MAKRGRNRGEPPAGRKRAGAASGWAPCWCRGAQRRGGRAQRASLSSLPELFERSGLWAA